MSSFLNLLTINTLLHALRQEKCKNNKILLRSKNYKGIPEPSQPIDSPAIKKKEGASAPSFG
jgi:hypothetical protein